MKTIYAFPVLLALTAPAMAGSFKPPEGCTTYLTVQSKGCRVSNHYTCEGQPAGDKWRADSDQEGVFFISRINDEGEWIESIEVNPEVHESLDPNPADPASFSALLSTGRDDFNFGLSDDTGQHTKVTGHDALTGKSVVIDGVTLQQTEFEFVETDAATGQVLRQSRGNEYISPEWRMFFSGPSEWDGGQGYVPLDGSPVEFILPGEPGFATTQPLFDCDAVMSSLPMMSPLPEEAQSHDNL